MDDAVIAAVPDVAVHTRFFSLGAVDPSDNVFRRVNELFEAGAAERQHHFSRHIILRFISGPLLCFLAEVLQANADIEGLVDVVHYIIVQAAHIVAQPALINCSDLLQHSHRTLRKAEERWDADVDRLAEFLRGNPAKPFELLEEALNRAFPLFFCQLIPFHVPVFALTHVLRNIYFSNNP